jgi:pimeloyl-ACP methyl ester carboxylesterase
VSITLASFTTPDGATTASRATGALGPALVFVHGVGSTAAIWDKQLLAFANDHRCYAIELRGNGVPKPEPDPALISREGYATDVLTVLDAHGIENFTIVGCSLGGVVAFELWKRVPQRLSSMVIVGSFAAYPNARAYADGIKAAATEAGDMATFATARAAKLGLPPDRMKETLEQMACKDLNSYLAATEATWTGDYTAMLSTITVPALVCCGERDAIAPPELSKVIANGIPDALYHLVPNAGHVANADNPSAFNAMLREFLSAAPVG